MHFEIMSLPSNIDTKNFDKLYKSDKLSHCRSILIDSVQYKKFLSELANRTGISDLKQYKKDIGKIIFNYDKYKVYLLEDLTIYDDKKITNYINKLLIAKNRVYYKLLPLFLRPVGSTIGIDDVNLISDGLERVQDHHDLEVDFINELLELCYHARDNNCVLYFHIHFPPPPSAGVNVNQAITFAGKYTKVVLIPQTQKLLLDYKLKKYK